jgi:hypothetical protein
MRHLLIVSAAVALSSAALAGCDDDDRAALAPARTATATQCAPAPLPACAGKTRTATPAAASTRTSAASHALPTGGVYRARYHHAGHAAWREGGGHGQVDHYGYVDQDQAYASGATMRGGMVERQEVSRSEGYSQSSGYSESAGYAESAGYSEGGGYGEGRSWRSSGHQGRLVIRGGHGQTDSWTWRTAGRDDGGYLVWPGKSPR